MRIFLLLIVLISVPWSIASAQTAPRTKSETIRPLKPVEFPPREADQQPLAAVAAPTPAPIPPIVVQPAPPPQVTVQAAPRSEIFDWVWSGLLGLVAAIFGVKTVSDMRKPSDLLTDTELRAKIDEQIVKVVESGAPGKLISGAVPAFGIAEPFLRSLLLKMLEDRITGLRANPGQVGDDDLIKRLLSQLQLQQQQKPPALGHGQG